MTTHPIPPLDQLPPLEALESFHCSHVVMLDGQMLPWADAVRILQWIKGDQSRIITELRSELERFKTQIADLRAGDAPLSADDINAVLKNATVITHNGKPIEIIVPVIGSDKVVRDVRMPCKVISQ